MFFYFEHIIQTNLKWLLLNELDSIRFKNTFFPKNSINSMIIQLNWPFECFECIFNFWWSISCYDQDHILHDFISIDTLDFVSNENNFYIHSEQAKLGLLWLQWELGQHIKYQNELLSKLNDLFSFCFFYFCFSVCVQCAMRTQHSIEYKWWPIIIYYYHYLIFTMWIYYYLKIYSPLGTLCDCNFNFYSVKQLQINALQWLFVSS